MLVQRRDGIRPSGLGIFFPHGMTAAGRTHSRKLVRLRIPRPLVEDDSNDLRNDVACALHDDSITDADIDAVSDRLAVVADRLDVILVVQRRVLHHHTTDRHRRELRHRRQRAGAANLNLDVVENRGRLLGGELVRDGPAGAARHKTKTLLPVEPVHLVDHAVDVVAERSALLLDLAVELQQPVDIVTQRNQRIGDKARLAHPLDHVVLGLGRHRAHFAPGIGEEFQRTRRGDRRIFLAQRSRRRIARIGEHGVVRFGLPLVQRQEILLEHVDFAANFADRGDIAPLQLVRNIGQRAHVGGHVLAGEAVAARRTAHQFPILIAQRQRQPVDFRLGDDDRYLVIAEFEKTPHAIDEIRDILVAESVAEREHRHRMRYFCEAACRRNADLFRRRVPGDEPGKPRLDGVAALAQLVIGRI